MFLSLLLMKLLFENELSIPMIVNALLFMLAESLYLPWVMGLESIKIIHVIIKVRIINSSMLTIFIFLIVSIFINEKNFKLLNFIDLNLLFLTKWKIIGKDERGSNQRKYENIKLIKQL